MAHKAKRMHKVLPAHPSQTGLKSTVFLNVSKKRRKKTLREVLLIEPHLQNFHEPPGERHICPLGLSLQMRA